MAPWPSGHGHDALLELQPCVACGFSSVQGFGRFHNDRPGFTAVVGWLVIGPMIVVCAGRAATDAQDTPTLLVAVQRQSPRAGIDHVTSHVAYYSMV